LKSRRSRTFLYSFAITLVILSALLIFLYNSPSEIQVRHLPDNIRRYEAFWERYVPSDALLVGFKDFIALRSVNSSLPPNEVLIDMVTPRATLNSEEVNYILTVVLQIPNATVDIAFVKPSSFTKFEQLFAKEGQFPVNVGDSTLYSVRYRFRNTLELGWTAIIPDDKAIAFARGTASAKEAITESLRVLQGDLPSILSREDINQMLYIAGDSANHLGLQIQNFPGVVRTGEMTLIAIDAIGGSVQISYVIKFSNPEIALSQYQTVKSAHLSARQFAIFDSYVEAIEYQSISSVEEAIKLVG
jgi:hypothetical protein